MGLKSNFDFVKHLLNYHDGESREVYHRGWTKLPEGTDILDHAFWDYQYAKTYRVRSFLYDRDPNAQLSGNDIRWIMREEDNETRILRWVPPPASGPASGGISSRPNINEWDFYIRQGNYITLAELFNYGQYVLSCYHLYLMYINMPIYIHKRCHSVSTSENAIYRENAKSLRKVEHGTFQLPMPGESWD